MCHDSKELSFKLKTTSMVGGTKLNLVSMDQMNYDVFTKNVTAKEWKITLLNERLSS
jgi:hypothetical protein